MAITDTQKQILTAAAQHPQHLATPPERLPGGARQTVARALLKQNLVIAVHRPAYDARALWTVDGDSVLLKITDEGLRAIGIEPVAEDDEQSEAAIMRRNAERRAAAEADGLPTGGNSIADGSAPLAPTGGEDATRDDTTTEADDPAQAAPVAPTEANLAEDVALLDQALATLPATPRTSLREAAAAVLAAWDDETNRDGDMIGALHQPMERLRALLAGKSDRPAREPTAPRKPREGTKQEQVLAMLRRPEGATIAQIAEVTGWQQHTVRGFFAGLKKRQGIEVTVLERVRQVGPNKEGAKGSFSVYKVAV